MKAYKYKIVLPFLGVIALVACTQVHEQNLKPVTKPMPAPAKGDLSPMIAAQDPPTFETLKRAILQKNCAKCHNADDGAPPAGINFNSYESIKGILEAIREAVVTGQMGSQALPRLSEDQKRLFLKWLDAGGPYDQAAVERAKSSAPATSPLSE